MHSKSPVQRAPRKRAQIGTGERHVQHEHVTCTFDGFNAFWQHHYALGAFSLILSHALDALDDGNGSGASTGPNGPVEAEIWYVLNSGILAIVSRQLTVQCGRIIA